MEKPDSVEIYFRQFNGMVLERLETVYQCLYDALPDTCIKISYGIPTFSKNRNIIYIAAYDHHIGVYPGSKAIAHFEDSIKSYPSAKGSVQFLHKNPLPLDLIREIALYCMQQDSQYPSKKKKTSTLTTP